MLASNSNTSVATTSTIELRRFVSFRLNNSARNLDSFILLHALMASHCSSICRVPVYVPAWAPLFNHPELFSALLLTTILSNSLHYLIDRT
jgi:hypothetical protein